MVDGPWDWGEGESVPIFPCGRNGLFPLFQWQVFCAAPRGCGRNPSLRVARRGLLPMGWVFVECFRKKFFLRFRILIFLSSVSSIHWAGVDVLHGVPVARFPQFFCICLLFLFSLISKLPPLSMRCWPWRTQLVPAYLLWTQITLTSYVAENNRFS